MKLPFPISALLAAAAALFVTSCASTPQPELTNLPGDFRLSKIQADLWDVRYTGTAGMRPNQAASIAGQRVSTLCLNQDYHYFLVLERESTWETRPGDPTLPVENIAAHEHNVPILSGQVKFFKKDPKILDKAVYDAEQAQQNLRAFQ
ncbi:MAG: hypothetical protein ACC661_05850 [Verrucomicrobiales bacterium]